MSAEACSQLTISAWVEEILDRLFVEFTLQGIQREFRVEFYRWNHPVPDLSVHNPQTVAECLS